MQQLQQVQQVQQTRKKLPSYSSASHYGGDTDWKLLNEAAADVARFKVQQLKSGSSGGSSSSSSSKSGSKRSKKRWARQLQELPGWLLYRYYNWRQDGVSDLLLITAVSTTLLITAALLKRTLVDPSDPTALLLQQQQQYLSSAAAAGSAAEVTAAAPAEAAARLTAAAASPAAPELVDSAFPASSSSSSSSSVDAVKRWLAALGTDVYQVMVLSFGENFPNPDDGVSPVEELFSIGVALSGLAGFALALALVEQVVLETNMANVKRGSPVYEAGHYLVLGWAVSQRDLELLIKLVGQLISSAAADGGATIVVLTQREKLEMEELFRRTIPPAARAGSRLVFRQGSPLLPTDLSNVAASKARSTIIISDQSRGRDEADAQSLRCAILLDELDGYRGLRKGRAMGHIVVETRTPNAVPLLRFSCSKRVIALPAGHMNARRLARMLKRPFISWVSQRLWAFDSRCSLFMHAAHDLTGTRFRSLAFLFPDAIVMGVAHMASGRVTLNPMLDYVLAADDELILCRPTAIPTAAAAKDSSDSHKDTSSFNYVPREYLAVDSSPEALMVCGWSESGFMAELLYELDSGASCLPSNAHVAPLKVLHTHLLLCCCDGRLHGFMAELLYELDSGASCLPPGSEIVFVNCHPPEDTLGALLRGKTLTNVKVSHVYADPLQRNQLAALPLARFRAAIVLADAVWADPDGDERNGIDSIDQPSVLRQDSLMVMVQLNIRKLLEDLALPPINIICQKVATQGLTRFEDRRRLPLGISINFNSMAAKLLTQVAVNPLSMLVMNSFGMRADLTIVDASEYCGRGEAISFWRVLSRAQSAGDVLLGYYVLPSHIDQPIESTINPQGLAARSVQRVWNTGDGRLKFMVICDKECEAE
ncbi:hypothetical protein OEZ85_004619 [Tetradesmus obliquus]|uniref:Uncharacterized protein n=1 Tax=Tetradesmus obliquus TaxID=3088 RepID=A0ABY8UL92_TETOB|nr:hypothetical protein OEZ85_004619 [Tetradesmus obliquus]